MSTERQLGRYLVVASAILFSAMSWGLAGATDPDSKDATEEEIKSEEPVADGENGPFGFFRGGDGAKGADASQNDEKKTKPGV